MKSSYLKYARYFHLIFICILAGQHSAVAGDFTYTTYGVDEEKEVTITGYSPEPVGALVIPATIDGHPVVAIGFAAFWNSGSLTSVFIPNSVTSIGDSAFASCDNLSNISVDISNPYFSSLDGVFFNKDKTSLYQCPQTKSGNYTIPNSVIYIGDEAFYCCTGLTNVTIPNSVTSIGNKAFLACKGLSEIIIPSLVTSIGHAAFVACDNLTDVTISSSVSSIGDGAFHGCSNLSSITVHLENLHYSSEDGVLFNNDQTKLIRCPETKSGIYEIPSSVTSIEEKAFSGCSDLESVTIPSGVTSIEYNTFDHCSGLTSITLPNGITTIGESAFGGCSSLTKAIFLCDAPTIGSNAFTGTAAGFSIYYHQSTSGYTTPLWEGYPAEPLSSSPEIEITEVGGNTLTDGGSGIDFGTIFTGESITKTFRILNVGGNNLTDFTLTKSGENPADFLITNLTVDSLTTGESMTFTVTFSPAEGGLHRGIIYIGSNDPDASPFDLQVSGRRADVTSGIDLNEMTIIHSGEAEWFVQSDTTHDGIDAVRSGNIINNHSSSFSITATEEGSVSFWWKVSSEAGFDYLRFFIDGVEQGAGISGEVDWQQMSYPISAGSHTLTWTYLKNGGLSSGSDCGWVDQVSVIGMPEMAVEHPDGSNLTDGGTFDFSSLPVGSSRSNTFTIKNTGTAPLTGIDITIDGPDSFHFYYDFYPYESDILPGESMTFELYFTPYDEGNLTASIHIASNEADGNSFDIDLTGYGASAGEFNYSVVNGNVTIIGYNGLGGEVSIPATIDGMPVTSIDNYALAYSEVLITSFTVDPLNADLSSLDGVIFNKDKTTLIHYPTAKVGNYTIPLSVISIGDGAFFNCLDLTSITIPSGITTMGHYVFDQCESLERVVFLGDAPTVGWEIFDGASPHFVIFYYPESTGFTSPTWQGYPAMQFTTAPNIILMDSDGTLLTGVSTPTNFGNVYPGENKEVSFTIINSSLGDLSGLAITTGGPDSSTFTVSPLSSTTLATGERMTFTITFSPAAIAAHSAVIHIASNDPEKSPFDIELVGNGLNPDLDVATGIDLSGTAITHSGESDWIWQSDTSYDGLSAAQSGDVSDDQNSTFSMTVNDIETVSFLWKVSSEGGYDFLRFYIDGVEQGYGISGEVDWQQVSYNLSPGSHTLKWSYIKDNVFSFAGDCGWVDQVTFSALGTAINTWRQDHFGTILGSGDAADSADPDGDGLTNLQEFAYGLNPQESSAHFAPTWQHNGNNLDCFFTQPSGVSGIIYGAEWSPSLQPDSWLPITDLGSGLQHIYIIPVDSSQNRFVRLKITKQ